MRRTTVSRDPFYRTRQLIWALRPRISAAETADVESLLGSGLSPLFFAMDGADQRHCIDVYKAARRAGCEDQDVLAAALIHDCGKAPSPEDGRIRLWHRITYVVLKAMAPALLRRFARRPGGLRLLDRHAARGLEMAAASGASPDVIAIMQGMDGDGADADEWVRLLRAADDRA